MSIGDVLMTIRIRLCSLDFFPTKIERPIPTNDHGESPMHGRRAEGVSDASEHSVPQPTTPSTPHHPARHDGRILSPSQPRKAVVAHRSPLFIHRRRNGAAADRMAPPPNVEGVYFLAQIHEGVAPRSFASEVYTFNVGEECAYGNGTWMRLPWRVGREKVAGS